MVDEASPLLVLWEDEGEIERALGVFSDPQLAEHTLSTLRKRAENSITGPFYSLQEFKLNPDLLGDQS